MWRIAAAFAMMAALGLASTDAAEDVLAMKDQNWKRDLRGGTSAAESESESESESEDSEEDGAMLGS